MNGVNQLIKLGLYAERAHRLAFDMALSVAELSHFGSGMAMIAEETRNIGKRLYSIFEGDGLNEREISEATLELRYLIANGCIEMLRLHESQYVLIKRIAVILEEISNVTVDTEKLFGIAQPLPLVIPHVTPKSSVLGNAIDSTIKFVLFSIGGIPFCETTANILEISRYSVEQIRDNFLCMRGEKLPLLNLYKKLSIEAPEDN